MYLHPLRHHTSAIDRSDPYARHLLPISRRKPPFSPKALFASKHNDLHVRRIPTRGSAVFPDRRTLGQMMNCSLARYLMLVAQSQWSVCPSGREPSRHHHSGKEYLCFPVRPIKTVAMQPTGLPRQAVLSRIGIDGNPSTPVEIASISDCK